MINLKTRGKEILLEGNSQKEKKIEKEKDVEEE